MLLNTYMVAIALFNEFYSLFSELFTVKKLPTSKQSFFIGTYFLNFVLSVTLSFFFKFHIKLTLENSTTIETMDKKSVSKVNYNKGFRKNWEQVFGKNPWMWLLPFNGESGKPIGDGVVWTQPISIDIDDIPDEGDFDRKNGPSLDEKIRKSDVSNKNIGAITAPDSLGSIAEKSNRHYFSESKQSSRITEKAVDNASLNSP